MAVERELKFSVTEDSWPPAAALAKALSHANFELGAAELIRQRDRYYDTATGHLRQAGLALRKRSVNAQSYATLKTQGQVADGMHEREELELPMAAATWPEAIAAQLSPLVSLAQLRTQLELVTERLSNPVLRLGAPVAVLSFDTVRANYPGHDQQVTFYEVEIEAQGAGAPQLQAIADAVARTLPLTPSSASKLERASALLSLGVGFYE